MPSRRSEPSIALADVAGIAARHGVVVAARPPPELRRDHRTVAPAGERAAEEDLAVAAAVALGGVEQRDPGVERRVHDGACLGLVDAPAHVVAAEPDDGDDEARGAEVPFAHASESIRVCNACACSPHLEGMHTKMEVTLPKREPTDAELLRAAATDARAFRELYDRYAERIHGYHLRRTRDREAALDLAAETFAQAWLSRGRFRDEADGSAGPWLFAIARHVVLASVERGRIERHAMTRLGVLEALDRPAATAEPDSTWLDGLDEAMADLPVGQRAAVELRVVDDLSYEEVGDALGTSPRAARVRVHRGLRALRSLLTNGTEATR